MREWLATLGLIALLLAAGLAVRCNDSNTKSPAEEAPENAPSPTVATVVTPIVYAATPAATPAIESPTPSPLPALEIIPPETAFLPTATPAPTETPAPTPSPTPAWPLRILVSQKDGRPIAGAEIIAVWRDGDTPRRISGRTNSSGLFYGDTLRVSRLETISATAEGFSPAMIEDVSLESGLARIEMSLLPFLAGKALRPDGSPLEGPFTAIVFRATDEKRQNPENSLSLSSGGMSPIAVQQFSRTNGEFLFERLAPGDYFVAIWSEALLGGISERISLSSDAPSTSSPQRADNVKIVTYSSLSISGRAAILPSAGEADSPAAGIEIKATNRGAALARSGFPPQTTSTGVDGRYALEGLPGGLYTVEAGGESAGIEKAVREDFPLRSADSGTLDFALRPRLNRLSGTVRGDDGEPLPGTSVLLVRGSPAPLQRRTVADSQGRFEFAELSEGIYRLGVAHPHDSSRQKLLASEVKSGGDSPAIEVRFHPRHRVSGRVLREGLPAKVDLLKFHWREDLDGFRLEGGPILVPIDPKTGRYEVQIEPGNYEVSGDGIEPKTVVIQSETVLDFEVK